MLTAVLADGRPCREKVLSTIHAILNPRATPFSGLVQAVFSFSDNALKVLLAHGSQKFSSPPLRCSLKL